MVVMGLLGQLGAEPAPWETVRAAIRHDGPAPYLPLVAVVCIVGGAVAVALGVVWLVQRRRPAGAGWGGRLFRALGRELGLSWADQWLLMRVARQQALPSPLTLLVSAATLEAHTRAYAAGLPEGRGRRALARGLRVRERVFGNAEA